MQRFSLLATSLLYNPLQNARDCCTVNRVLSTSFLPHHEKSNFELKVMFLPNRDHHHGPNIIPGPLDHDKTTYI